MSWRLVRRVYVLGSREPVRTLQHNSQSYLGLIRFMRNTNWGPVLHNHEQYYAIVVVPSACNDMSLFVASYVAHGHLRPKVTWQQGCTSINPPYETPIYGPRYGPHTFHLYGTLNRM
jgi:hypothetical protein